jgi:hypothetical protein
MQYFRRTFVLSLALVTLFFPAAGAQQKSAPQLSAPIAVYSHDATQGQAVAGAPFGEQQALRDLDELLRLKHAGVRTDYDLMEPSWFAPESGYHQLQTAGWPNGPDAWLTRCRAAGIRPGMQLASNAIPAQTKPAQIPPAWKDSMDQDSRSLSLFEGGFLPDLMAAMQSWYDRGVRLFAFDSVDLSAATPASAAKLSQAEITGRNAEALRQALKAFREKNGDAVVLVSIEPGLRQRPPAISNSGVAPAGENSPAHFDSARFGSFTVVSTGVPLPSASPQANLWRSFDIGSDESVRRLEQSGVSLAQIDSTGFTASDSADRGMRAWKGAFLLSMARGGWVNSIHGDLSLIDQDDARWLAHVQRLFLNLQDQGHMGSFGGPAGGTAPYGFAAGGSHGTVYAVVNPGEAAATLTLPTLGAASGDMAEGRLLFRDAGFTPVLNGNALTLGPGQMAVVGYGAYTSSAYNFGTQQDVMIPNSVEIVDADFHSTDSGALEGSFNPPIEGVVRVILRPSASTSQSFPSLKGDGARGNRAQAFTLDASQYGRPVPVRLDDGSELEHSMGWTIAEIDVNDLTPGVPLVVRFHSNSSDMSGLEASAYAVNY